MSTIAIDPDVKELLNELKIVPNESNNSVIKRLVCEVKEKRGYTPMFPKEERQGQKNPVLKILMHG